MATISKQTKWIGAVVIVLVLAGIVLAANGYVIADRFTTKITEHTVTKNVYNDGCPASLFVPTKSSAEWSSFRNNLPTCAETFSISIDKTVIDVGETATITTTSTDPYGVCTAKGSVPTDCTNEGRTGTQIFTIDGTFYHSLGGAGFYYTKIELDQNSKSDDYVEFEIICSVC